MIGLVFLLSLFLPSQVNSQTVIAPSTYVGAGGSVSGPLYLTDGTAAAPSLAFISDPATGLYKWAGAGLAFVSTSSNSFLFHQSTAATSTVINLDNSAGGNGVSIANIGVANGQMTGSVAGDLVIRTNVGNIYFCEVLGPGGCITSALSIGVSGFAGVGINIPTVAWDVVGSTKVSGSFIAPSTTTCTAATAPFYFTSDTNTGFNNPFNDYIGWCANGIISGALNASGISLLSTSGVVEFAPGIGSSARTKIAGVDASGQLNLTTSSAAVGIGFNVATVNILSLRVLAQNADAAIRASLYNSSTLSELAVATNVIAPTSTIHSLGAGLIKTITVPTTCTPTCVIQIIPLAAYTYDATGNITVPVGGGLALISKVMTFVWDGTKWNPSY